MHQPPLTPTRILRQSAVVARVGVSPTTLWRWHRSGRFPAPVRLGANSVGWREADIEQWLASRIAVSDGPEAA